MILVVVKEGDYLGLEESSCAGGGVCSGGSSMVGCFGVVLGTEERGGL